MRQFAIAITTLALCAGTQYPAISADHAGHSHGGGQPVENTMVLVPGGGFIMGSTPAEVEEVTKAFARKQTFNKEACKKEAPTRKVTVKSFYIDRYEVTNAQYREFILATGYTPPKGWQGQDYPMDQAGYPVVMVSYKDAQAYAKWAGKRLPTEAEWEKAARGTDGRTYPWGNKFEAGIAQTAEAVALFGGPVSAWPKDVSVYGVYDMAGNVSEWTSDWYDAAKKMKTIKGGAWAQLSHAARCAAKEGVPASGTSQLIGFRCVKDAPGK